MGVASKAIISAGGSLPGANTWSGVNTFDAQVQWSKGADVASATALPVLTDGNYFDVTGTTTITSINTTGHVGTVIRLHFDGILTLTHSATDLVLPGAANITTAAGDEATFVEYATGDYRCTVYTKASGEPVVSAGGGAWTLLSTITASASATVDFESELSSTFDNYAIIISDYQNATTGQTALMRVGTAAVYVATNYDYHVSSLLSNAAAYGSVVAVNTTQVPISGGGLLGVDGSNAANFTIFLNTVSRPNFNWQGNSRTNLGQNNFVSGGARLDTGGVVTSVQFFSSSGNITKGDFRLYGISNS